MECRIFREPDFHVTSWSGGKTKELFISPADSSYGRRDFDIRISSATVETEESLFTNLPGIDRLLIVLKGNIRISHGDEPFHDLPPFQGDSFTGEEVTRSRGRCIDFNVMVRRGSCRSLEHCVLSRFPASVEGTGGKLFLYAARGTFEIKSGSETEILKAGELFYAENAKTFYAHAVEPGTLIQLSIS